MTKLKRKVKKRISFFIIILFLLLVGVVSYNILFKDNSVLKEITNNEVEEEDPIKTYTASLIATGDALIHSPLYNSAYDSATGTYDFTSMLTYTKELISNYDIRYYNQETIFNDDAAYSSYPVFNTPSAFGQNMIDIGFNMVSLATNHSMDGGKTGALASASWWESQTDVLTNGMATSEEARTNYQIFEVNGITYTMLSYTYGTNGLGTSSLATDPYLVNVWDEELVLADIEAVRDQVDILIVAMHWGTEYNQDITDTQKEQAEFLAENGVDIIIGNHSHCIEPWEWIGDTVVFYSLGNFISNQGGAESALIRKVGVVGVFVTLEITKTVDTENDTTTIEIGNIGANLNYTYRSYNSTRGKYEYLVIPFSEMEEKYLSNYAEVYEEFSAVLTKYDDSIVIEPLPSS